MNAPIKAGIHPTAIVDPAAEVAPGVEVGPYAVIGPQVKIGAGCRIGPHAVINGRTRIGAGNTIYQFASIGEPPQDTKYRGEPTSLEIGDGNTIREFCTIHRGSVLEDGITRIGNDNFMMAYSHVAHDCQVGSRTVLVNNAQLAGHVRVGDDAILGGFTAVHQHCRIGAHSITGLGTIVLHDIPPYVKAFGNPARPFGVNVKGLRHRGYAGAVISGLKRGYKTLYRSGLTLEEARAELAIQAAQLPELKALLDFIAVPGRGIIR